MSESACVLESILQPVIAATSSHEQQTATAGNASEVADAEDPMHLTFSPPLYAQRYSFTYDKLFKANPPIAKMADFGCAEGKFIEHLKQLPFLQELSAVDMDERALGECLYSAQPRAWNYIFPRYVQLVIRLMKASVLVPDPTFCDLDAITCIELIEHLPVQDLIQFRNTLFGFFRPRIIIITTPNSEFNVLFPQLRDGKLRHWDHRFEWTRREFEDWCSSAASSFGYAVSFTGVGDPPADFQHVGHCSQIAVFERQGHYSRPKSPYPVTCELLKYFDYPQREKDAVEEKAAGPFDWSLCQNEN